MNKTLNPKESFQKYLKDNYGGIDIFIHNAASRQNPNKTPQEEIEQFVRVNNLGTIRILNSFVPLLKDKAHFLMVASSFGSLQHLNPALHSNFDSESLTIEQLTDSLKNYVECVKEGTDIEKGYPHWMNIVSKIGQVASLRIVAREWKEEAGKRKIMLNSICPGLLDTDASRPWFDNMSHALHPDDATDDIWWVIEQGWQEGMYGKLYQHRKEISWV